jgi:hypothetical protein
MHAIRDVKSGKGPGPDGIINEMMKSGYTCSCFGEMVLNVYNVMLV